MKDMGSNNLTYLGISILKQNGQIYLNQTKYLQNVLKKYGMQNCKGMDTPMDPNLQLDVNTDIDMTLENYCRSLIGSLMYCMVSTRPDLATAVSYLSRFQGKPSVKLVKALKRVLRYIKQTVNYQLTYTNCNINNNNTLVGYADSDFARSMDRKSTSGYVFKLYGNTISWKSKKQNIVTLSTTEAELVALCESCVESCWLIKLLKDVDVNLKHVTIFEDNQSTIKTVNNPDQKRLKHIDIKYNFVKEKVEQGLIRVMYISTNNQLADIMTKPLTTHLFRKFVTLLGLEDWNIEGEC